MNFVFGNGKRKRRTVVGGLSVSHFILSSRFASRDVISLLFSKKGKESRREAERERKGKE